VRDAFDEVYGGVPAIALPDSRRVIVTQSSSAGHKRLQLDAYDVAKQRKLATRTYNLRGWPLQLWPLGESALLTLCDTDAQTCRAAVLKKNLDVEDLHLSVDPKLMGGRGEPSEPLWRSGSEWALVDATGASVLFVDAKGRVLRRVELPLHGQSEQRAAHAGRRNATELIVLPEAPNAGVVNLVDVATGAVRSLEPNACEAP
jgi:hypothetical protein